MTARPKTRAHRTSNGDYVLNGTKQFITIAGFADVFTVFAQVRAGEGRDTISHVYALDSAVRRVRQIFKSGSTLRKTVARDLLTAFAPPAYSYCVHTVRHILMDTCDEKALPRLSPGLASPLIRLRGGDMSIF